MEDKSMTKEQLLRALAECQEQLRNLEVGSTEVTEWEWKRCQAQKMETARQLAGGVAHNFNNLLTVITGHCELLLDRHIAVDSSAGWHIDQIEQAGQQGAALVNQLVTFCQRQRLQPETLDLNVIITRLKPKLRSLVGTEIELVIELEPALPPVTVDPAPTELVLQNMARNARDAMPQGGTLTLTTTTVKLAEADPRLGDLKPGSYVMLVINDTGQGMDEDTQARIFEPFFTTKEQGRGTGLSLAMVHGFIRQSGGHIKVVSEPGRGTTFTIYLPRSEPTVSPDDNHQVG